MVKWVEDLFTLIDCPYHLQYLSRQDLMQLASMRFVRPKINKSLAKRRWWMVGQFLPIFKPLRIPALSWENNNLEKTFEPRINKKGERGSPCLKLLVGENFPKGLPFSKMEKEVEEIQMQIHFILVAWKPNFSIMAKRKFHSISSKVFTISVLRDIKPPLPFLFLKEWNNSWARVLLSSIFWLVTKADWREEMILGSKSYNRLAIIFVMIL